MVATAVTATTHRCRLVVGLAMLLATSVVVVAFPISASVGAATPNGTTTTSGVPPTTAPTTTTSPPATTTTSPSATTTTVPTTSTTSPPPTATSPPTAKSPAVNTAPKWDWVDRGPTLVAVSCTTPDTCVAVGGTGSVLRSIGGGTSHTWSQVPWSAAQTTANETLASVTCLISMCLAVSSSGATDGVSHVYRSTDDGLKWADKGALPKAAGGTQVASSLDCQTAKQCVIAGGNGGIWRSVNEGETWKALAPAPPLLGYTTVACPTATTCIALGKGGAGSHIVGDKVSPIKITGAGDLTALSCLSATTCLAADTLSNFYRTTNAGKTFASAGLTPGSHPVIALSCTSDTRCTGLNDSKQSLTTTDGGTAWKTHVVPAPGLAGAIALSCAAAACAAVGPSALVMSSANEGATWATTNAVPDVATLSCKGGGTSELICLSGGKDAIGKSTSGGNFWLQPISGVSQLEIQAVSCADEPSCIAMGKSLALRSDDYGRIWKLAKSPASAPGTGPSASSCFTSLSCVAVGSGTVFTTLNGAKKWYLGSIPGGPMLAALSCPTTTLCYAAAGNGEVDRGTRPAGTADWSWDPQSIDIPAGSKIGTIACTSPTTCLAMGANGVVARTTDSGDNWSVAVTDISDNWTTVSCVNMSVCVAGGAALLGTSDNGGVTWTRDTTATKTTVATITCPTTTLCIAGGTTVLEGRPPSS
jgi:photosystem II stability/assembly factor-like uncharacterized protein